VGKAYAFTARNSYVVRRMSLNSLTGIKKLEQGGHGWTPG
jgi:hypothetical protein